MTWIHRGWPILLAAIIMLLNAAKPVVVDDTAYLLHARHLAQHPTQPYDFTIFWNDLPQPAMEVLLPPVLPYWLSLGISLVGENLFLLKLSLLPWVLLLVLSVRSLVRRWAPEHELQGTVLIAGSPLVLPLFNFMLDVPAVSLGLATVALTMRVMNQSRPPYLTMLAAGLCAALAMQTKYSMLALPGVVLWCGWTHRRLRWACAIALLSVVAFALWEMAVASQCGQSHFLTHLQRQSSDGDNTATIFTRVTKMIAEKMKPVQPLAAYLGGLAVPMSIWAAYGIGLSRRFMLMVILGTSISIATVCLSTGDQQVLLRDKTGKPTLTLPMLVFTTLGWTFLATISAVCVFLLVRWHGFQLSLRHSSTSLFLVGWWLIEIIAFFALTPFPAARRVIMVGLVAGFIALRLTSLTRKRPGSLALAFSVTLCLTFWGIDCYDGSVEPLVAREAMQKCRAIDPKAKVWTQGHWGWQYETERLGMMTIVPGESVFAENDILVKPVEPHPGAFYRPYHGEAIFAWDETAFEFIERIQTTDTFPPTTLPSLYGGNLPMIGSKHPRLIVDVYRVRREYATQFDYRR